MSDFAKENLCKKDQDLVPAKDVLPGYSSGGALCLTPQERNAGAPFDGGRFRSKEQIEAERTTRAVGFGALRKEYPVGPVQCQRAGTFRPDGAQDLSVGNKIACAAEKISETQERNNRAQEQARTGFSLGR